MARVAGHGALVGHYQAGAQKAGAGGRVERDPGAVVAAAGRAGEALDLAPVGRQHRDLLRQPDQRHVDPPRRGDREAVREVAGPALPQLAERPGLAAGADRHRVELAGGRVERTQAGRAALRHVQALAAGGQHDAGGAELAAVEPLVGQPHRGRASPRRHAPHHSLAVVGHVQGAVRPPGAVVGDRRPVGQRRRAVGPGLARGARLEVGEGGEGGEPAGVAIEPERARGRVVEHHEIAVRVAGGDLHAVVSRQVLPGHGPGPQRAHPCPCTRRPRRRRAAARIDVGALVDPAVGMHVAQRGKAGRGDAGQQVGVEARPLGGARSRWDGGDCHRRERQRHRQRPSHSASFTSAAARSPERTAPSM